MNNSTKTTDSSATMTIAANTPTIAATGAGAADTIGLGVVDWVTEVVGRTTVDEGMAIVEVEAIVEATVEEGTRVLEGIVVVEGEAGLDIVTAEEVMETGEEVEREPVVEVRVMLEEGV